MKKPRVLVFAGYGLNCEEETAFAFSFAGAEVDMVHVNDLVASPKRLHNYHILAFPGGFAYGDDTGAGNAYANKLRNHLWEELATFVKKDRLVIGICNGCQILVALGLVPALGGSYGVRQVALLHNSTARYTVRWTDVAVEGQSPWIMGISRLSLPIAHGEGRLYAPKKVLDEIEKKHLIALRYENGQISKAHHLPANPTGTLHDIAGLINENGRILGIMPHPERAISFTQLPHWTLLKESYRRKGQKLPTAGPGLQIFQNAIRYFS